MNLKVDKHIPKIVITGVPCGGKTTGMSYCVEKLQNYGFKPIVVPETPTMFILSGLDPKIMAPDEYVRFEESLLNTQLQLEDNFIYLAAHMNHKKPVLLFDRGIMDIAAYLSKDQFGAVVDDMGMSIPALRDKRYDGIFHLVTAASGAEKFYTCANNPARLETSLDDAREADRKTMEAWVGAPHLQVVDNSTDFEGKMKRTFQSICRVLGIPVPIENERKYLVSGIKESELPHHQRISIEQVYLLAEDDNEEVRIRKRGQNGAFCYYKTHKSNTGIVGKRYEKERPISGKEYCEELIHADPSRVPIVKERICFLWENQYFELDIIKSPEKYANKILLEIEMTEDNANIKLPPFIQIEKEVTDDPSYSNSSLALQN